MDYFWVSKAVAEQLDIKISVFKLETLIPFFELIITGVVSVSKHLTNKAMITGDRITRCIEIQIDS